MELPFSVREYTNPSGTKSYRVEGRWRGGRMRRNFAERDEADTVCNAKNLEAAETAAKGPPRRVVQTFATDKDLRHLEAALTRIAGQWPLSAVLDAGIAALSRKGPALPVGALVEEWLGIVKGEVSERWYADLRDRVRRFAADHPDLVTRDWDRAVTRKWLDHLKTGDGQPMSKTSKANMRTAVHRFGVWLVERGHMNENPAGGIRVTGRMSGAKQADRPLPSIFTPRQAEALLHVCQLGACRRLLGWMATCLFTGMRPDSEAPRATWAEVDLKAGEWSVMGRKRGAKPRVIPLTPAAVAWLKVVKADAMEKPAIYSRRSKARAIELANAWLAENHPGEKPIVWDEDITRHTFASYRAPEIPVHKLAEELGNSPGTIYAHYRHPQPAARVKAFWALRPGLVA